jgi:protein YibB
MDMIITTALFDLDRGNWVGYKRSVEDYKNYSKNMLSLDCKMVIYTTPNLKEHFIENRKLIDPSLNNTIIVTMNLEDIPYYDYLDKITNLMNSQFFIENIKNKHHDKLRPESNYPIYNIVQFAKSKFVENTIKNNFFNSELHCWMDIGIYQHTFPSEFKFKKYPTKNVDILNDNKIHQFYRQYPRESDIDKLKYYCESDDVRIVGAWFGGTKSALLKYSEIINKVVDDSINESVISDDQNIYTICFLENKELFNLHNGNFANNAYFAGLDFFI